MNKYMFLYQRTLYTNYLFILFNFCIKNKFYDKITYKSNKLRNEF